MEDFNKNAILVNITPGKDGEKVLAELSRLAETADYEVVSTLIQRREKPDKTYHIGKGRLEELKAAVDALEADTVIFDNDLSGSQFYNLETFLEVRILDRRTLILEIFARHATSNEGKLQVELAQKKNALPRVMGKGFVLSRQGGGGGGGGGARRGGGEQQLELDKRTLRREIQELEEKIDKLTEERSLRRLKRQKNQVKAVAIVGYTNVGKSTLMNTLTKAGVLEENKLFATLDPVSRKLWLESGKEFLLVDTVGFISRLPHDLVKAFRSTLEEAKFADLILHVVDGSSEDALEEYDVANEVLASLGITDTPVIVVINKTDAGVPAVLPNAEEIVFISAKTGEGVAALKEKIGEKLFEVQ